MSKAALKIEIFSDVVCPWCFIGKQMLFKALDKVKDVYDVSIAWEPFELNPEMPVEGQDRKAYRLQKFGSVERSKALEGQVAAAAREEGLHLEMDKIERIPNTFMAHRLSRFARHRGKQAEMMEALFKAYFVNGADVGNLETLLELAEKVGFDKDEVRTHLESNDGVELLRTEEQKGLRLGVNGVPYFRINDIYGISGAQAPDRFINAFREATEMVQALKS
jgi:predicted DsbA family dithiol-disulfide isomerase